MIINFCKSNNYKVLLNGFEDQYTLEDDYLNNTIYQFVVIVDNKNDVDKLIDFTNKNGLKISYISYAYYKNIPSDRYTTNINLLTTDKGKSIRILLGYLNIDKENSICFGDNFNDLKMFDNCGIKIAMKNGLQELKNNADYIALSNDEDGVAHFLNENIK